MSIGSLAAAAPGRPEKRACEDKVGSARPFDSGRGLPGAGAAEYNEALSRRRAESVVEYLVAKHDIPIYRIHMVGLGERKPLDEAKTRDARAKNRRVEVKVFSADQAAASLASQE